MSLVDGTAGLDLDTLRREVSAIVREAGEAMLRIYARDFAVE